MKSLLQAARRLISPAPSPFSGSPTQAYGEWWRQAAQTVRDARIATIDDLTEEQYIMRGLRGDANSPGAVQLLEWTGTPANKSARVLELGCGMARIGREMAPMVAEWHGVDISSAMIDHARARTQHLPNVHLHLLPATQPSALPHQTFASTPFDLVYCTVVLMHLDKEDLFGYLRALHAILKPGCAAYLDTWNIAHPDTFRIWRDAAVSGDDKPRGRIQGSTAEEFLLYIHKAGFEVERLDRNDRLLRAVVRRPAAHDTNRLPYPSGTIPDQSPQRSQSGDSFAPFGYVGNPRTGDRLTTGVVAMDGWVLDRTESVTVEVWSVDSQATEALRQVSARIHQPRPEVPAVFPEYPDRENCGWTAELPLEGLPSGELRIRVWARDQEGLVADLSGVNLTIVHEA